MMSRLRTITTFIFALGLLVVGLEGVMGYGHVGHATGFVAAVLGWRLMDDLS